MVQLAHCSLCGSDLEVPAETAHEQRQQEPGHPKNGTHPFCKPVGEPYEKIDSAPLLQASRWYA